MRKINFKRLVSLKDVKTIKTERLYRGELRGITSVINSSLKLDTRKSAVSKTIYINQRNKIFGAVDNLHKDLFNSILVDGQDISDKVSDVYLTREPELKLSNNKILLETIKRKTYGSTVNGKIKNILNKTKENIHETMLKGIIQHKTPKIILKDIQKLLNGKNSNIKYMFNRLIRTQNNIILMETTKYYNGKSKLTNGLKWHLSSTHKVEDICDVYAEYDSGLGTGVYSVDAVPDDHPNGRCYITDVMFKKEEIGNPKTISKVKPISIYKVGKIITSRKKLHNIQNIFNKYQENISK